MKPHRRSLSMSKVLRRYSVVGWLSFQPAHYRSGCRVEFSRPLQDSDQLARDGTAEAGTRIPTGSRGEAVVVAFRDVMEGPGVRVELGVEITDSTAFELIHERGHPRPEGRDGARPADDSVHAIATTAVACGGSRTPPHAGAAPHPGAP